MELWKKLLITFFVIAAIIVVIIIIFASAAKCQANNSQSSFCKFVDDLKDFIDDIITAIKWAIYAVLAGVVFGILGFLARIGLALLGKGDGDVNKIPDKDDSDTAQDQEDDENGVPDIDPDELEAIGENVPLG